MKSVILQNVSKTFESDQVLDKLSLKIPGGKFFALLGPSGCGKTTILRMIAGLETPDTGSIFLGEDDITFTSVNKRNVNTVFQSYALFPHLTVYENIAYSLRIKGLSSDLIDHKVHKVARMFHLESYLQKSINTISGGQQQRVAIARAVVNEPDVLLLDEPLAALDLRLREKVLLELIELQEQLGTTFIYITHDQNEALTVADQMAIMNPNGAIEQVGTPSEIYEHPKSVFVANFVGTTNILHGTLSQHDNNWYVEVDKMVCLQVDLGDFDPKDAENSQVYVGIRPEKIKISKHSQKGFTNHLSGIVKSIVYHGRSTQYNVQIQNGYVLQVFEQNEKHFEGEGIDYDDYVQVYWQKENSVLLKR